MKHGALDVTLGIEKSGRVRSLSFTGRNLESEIGEYTIVYSDFRDVSGFQLPFVERAAFNNAPDATRSRTLDSIAVNVALDPALFEPKPTSAR